jgi:hypothetical protein
MTTGIYYFPITLAYLAAVLRDRGHDVEVIDAFGEAPKRVRRWDRWWRQGLPLESVLDRAAANPEAPVFVYAGNLVSHEATLQILRGLSQRCARRPRIVLENTQAVTA